jgi:hypothetical protein
MRSPISTTRVAILGLAGCALAVACGREPTGTSKAPSGIRWSRSIAFNAEFPEGFAAYQQSVGLANQVAGAATAFTKVRIILNNADGSVALDTVVNFPPGVEELTVPLSVPLPLNAPSTGVALGLTLNYQNANGVTVFSGGPVSVNAVPAVPGAAPPPAAPVDVPLTYTGVGSSAAGVRITPKTITLKTGEAFSVAAVAVDASGNVIPSTPIVFVSENAALAQVNAASGAGSAGAARGTTRIIAQLLTNQQDAATVTIQSPPARTVAVSGDAQTAPVNGMLLQPVIVRVTATDGGPAPGVSVAFAAADGGTVGAATVVTGADGLASTTWRLGGTAGPQSLTASVAGLTGSPVTFAATARSVDPVRLSFTQQPPAASVAGAALAPSIVVTAFDAAGDVAKTFAGSVTLALGEGAPAGSALFGTRTATAVEGVATFSDLSLRVPGAYTLAASSGSLAGAISGATSVTHAPATSLAFQSYPIAGVGVGVALDPVTVVVRDAFGNVATSFTGPITLTLGTGSSIRADSATVSATPLQASQEGGAAALGLSMTANAVAGVATFADLRLTMAAGSQFSASSPGLSSVTGPGFEVKAGAPSALTLVSGGAQSAAGGAALAAPVIVKVADAFGNGVAGVTVSFAATAGSGTAAPATQTTNASGIAQTAWTLGAGSGPMTMNVSATGVAGAPLVVAATSTKATGPGPATQIAFTTQPSTSAAGVAMETVVVTARDANGAVATGYTEFVNLAIGTNPSSGAIVTGTTRIAAVAGVATFPGISLNKVGAGYTLVARDEALSATSSTFNVTPGSAAAIVADSGDGQSGTVGTALANPFVARVTDQFGNAVPGATVSWNVSAGTLGSVTTTTDANGRVRALLTLGGAAGQVTTSVAATIGELTPAVFTATALSGEATQLVFTTLPSESQAGATFAPGVVVTVKDGNGNTVTSFTGTVSLALDNGAGGGASIVSEGGPTLAGTTSVAAVGGVATFSNLSMTKAASGYAIVATSGPLSAKSGKFRIKAGPARRLRAVDGHDQANTVGKKLGKKFVILATDEFDNAAGGAPVAWTNVSGTGELEEQVLHTDSTGRASAGLKLGTGAGKHRVSAAVEGVEDPAVVFEPNAVADKAQKLKVVGGPSGGAKVKAGAKFASPLKVEAQDQYGNVDSTFTGNVSLRFAANPGADTAVAGGNDASATGGVAQFTNANIRKIGKGYRLRVTSADVVADSTDTFEIEAGPAKKIRADSGHGQSKTVGNKLDKKLVLAATDEFDNAVVGTTVTWTNLTSNGEIEESSATTDSTGRARAALKLSTGAGKHRIAAAVDGSGEPAIVFEANAVADKAKKLKLVGGPSGGSKVKAGAKFASPLKVEAQDQYGNVDSSFTGNISLRFAANPGADTAVAGGNDVTAANGSASFTNANIRKIGKGYRLRVTSTDVVADSTDTFEIEAGPAKKIRADSGHGQSKTVGNKLDKKLVLAAADEFDNVVAGATVTWSNLTSNGELEETSVTTDSTGRARAALKLSTGAGKHRIAAAVDGSGEPAIVFEADAVADKAKKLKLVGGPTGGSKVKAGAKFASPLKVEAQDQYGNVDSTFTGNISLRFAANPGADTAVAGGNDVTAANGSASFTNANIRKTGKGYRLRVTSADVIADSTDTFEIEAGPAKKIRADSGHGQSKTVGNKLDKKLVLAATDEFDNAVVGTTVTWSNLTSNGDLEETSVTTDSTGRARAALKLSTGAGKHRIAAAVDGSGEPAVVFEADAVADKAKKLKVVGGPSGGSKVKAGAKFASPLKVEAQDQYGNVDSSFTGNISLRFAANPGADTAVAGGNDVTAANGSASFTNANIRKIGKGYRLRVTSTDVIADSTDTFEIEAGPAKKIRADSGHGQSKTVGNKLDKKFVLAAADEFDNVVAGATVTWSNLTSNGELEETSVTTDSTGRARAALKLSTGAGKHRISAAVDGSGEPAIVFEADAIADKAKKLKVVGGPSGGSKVKAGAKFASPLKVEAQDQYGNVDSTFTGNVSLRFAANPGADTAVAGGNDASATGGVAQFTNANIRKIGKGYRLRVTSADVVADSTDTFEIEAGPAKKIRADSGHGQSKTVGNKLDKKLVLAAADEFDNVVAGATVTWSNLTSNGELEETSVTTDSTGRARAALKLSTGAGKHRIAAAVDGSGEPAIVFEADAIADKAKKLKVVGGPSGGSKVKAGAKFAAPLKVEAQDQYGNVDSTFTGNISLRFAANPGADTAVAGGNDASATGGIAQFTNANIRKIGKGYRLRVTSTDVIADSTDTFEIEAGPAKKIRADSGHGQSKTVGNKLDKKLVLAATDEFDNVVAGATVSWSVATGSGALEDKSLTTDSTGRARAAFKLGTGSGKQKVTAAIDGADGGPVEFESDAIAEKAKKLVVKGGPAGGSKVKAGAHFPSLQVEAQDEYGNIDLTYDGTVSLGLAANPGADSAIAGSKSGKASAGVISFTSANLRKTGAGYRVRASADAVISDSTETFTIESGPAKRIVADSGHGQSSTVGQKLSKKFVIRATDEFGNIASGATVTWTNVSGGGAIEDQSVTTDADGKARASLKLGNGAGKHRISAGIDGADDPAIEFEANAVAGAATKLKVKSGPSAGSTRKAGETIAVSVEALDEFDNVDSSFAGPISLGFETNPGADTAIAGSKVLNATGGIATFTTSNVRKTGSGYKLRASTGSLGTDTTRSFNVTANDPSVITIQSGNAQKGKKGQALNKPFEVSITDDYSNAVGGTEVEWTVTTETDDIVSQTTVTTDADGKAKVTLTLGQHSGKRFIKAKIKGKSNSVEFEAEDEESPPPALLASRASSPRAQLAGDLVTR